MRRISAVFWEERWKYLRDRLSLLEKHCSCGCCCYCCSFVTRRSSRSLFNKKTRFPETLRSLSLCRNDAFLDASERGDLPAMKDAVNRGADVRAVDADGRTALHIASQIAHVCVVDYLLQGAREWTVARLTQLFCRRRHRRSGLSKPFCSAATFEKGFPMRPPFVDSLDQWFLTWGKVTPGGEFNRSRG